MEDSERRSERLKAMRAMAAEPESPTSGPATAAALGNPLLETPALPEEPRAAPRFDYYTDPMAAFSANRRGAAADRQSSQRQFSASGNSSSPLPRFSPPFPGPRNREMTPPAYQMQNSYSLDQSTYQTHGPYRSAAPYRSPRGMGGSIPMHQGAPPHVWNGSGDMMNYYGSVPHRGMTGPFPTYQGNPNVGPAGSPGFNYGQGRPRWLGNSSSPGLGRGENPTRSLGRGQGQWRGGRSQGSGWNAGRGRGFRSHGSVLDDKLGPECFYDKSMVEDPWQNLEPVLWKELDVAVTNSNTPGSSNSWLAKYSSSKKPRVSEPSSKSSPQQSLAEYLAASFHEAVHDASSV